VIAAFKAKYPFLEVNELNPDAGSADELEAVRANKGNTGPQAPDVLDMGLSFGPAAQAEGLLQPYKVSTWDTIPDDAKDPDGHWYGDYYGVMAFAVNTDLVENVPTSFADLLKPEYAGMVALAGDPRASNQAILGIMAAGMARGAEPGAAGARGRAPVLQELNEAGNFVPVIGKAGTLAQGTTPIVIQWDYNALADPRHAGRQPAGRSRGALRCDAGRGLRAGDQRLCAAPERGEAVDGAPLFGRGAAWLAQGLLPPDPLQRHGRARRDPAGPDGRAAPGRSL
jgi:ABC-type Fe3+ transport system substrate-binding protein